MPLLRSVSMKIMPIILLSASLSWSREMGPEASPFLERSPSSQKKAVPQSSGTFYESENERKLEEITDRQIEELTRLIQRFQNSSRRGELWLRLAELYGEKARLVGSREQRRHSLEVEENEKSGSGVLPQLELDEARAYHQKAADRYLQFVEAFPRHPQVDQALFFLGYSYFELDRVNEGARYYRRLTEEFPNSVYISESSFALGEYYFDRENWQTALNHYRRVASDEKARLYIFALYKAGWCLYRLGRVDQAFSVMERVLIESRRAQQEESVAGRKKVNRLRLATEALRDLVPFYADSDRDYRKAYDYFSRTAGSEQAFAMIEKMAYYLSDAGDKEAARYLFRELIRRDPNSPKAFDYQYHIVTNYRASGKNEVFRRELMKWIEDYSSESQWHSNNQTNQEMIRDAEKARETALRNFVLQAHKTAKDSRQPYSQEVAREGYDLYLRAFPKSKNTGEMRFYYAELLFDMKDYEVAAKEYLRLVREFPKSEQAETSTENAVIALEKKLPSEKSITERVGKSTRAVPLSPRVKSFKETADLYLKRYPRGARRDRVRFKVGRLLYLHNQFDPALEAFQQVVKDSPRSELGEYSANLILDIYKLQEDYQGLQREGKQLLRANFDEKVEGEIQSIIEESSFKNAESLEKEKRYRESAQSFEAFAKTNPGSPLAGKAMFNAGVNFERAGQSLRAISVLSAFAGAASDSEAKLKRQARDQLLELYRDTGQYVQLAQTYELMAREFPKDRKREEYIFNAAVIWDDLGVLRKAIRGYENYYQIERKKEREEALFFMAEIWRREKDRDRALRDYRRYLASNPSSKENIVAANFEVARLYDQRGQREEAKKAYWKTISVQRAVSRTQRGVGRREAAESRLLLAMPSYTRFTALRWPRDSKKQAAALQRKLKALDRVKKEMTEVVKMGDADQIIAAFTLLGKANWHISRFFQNAPAPEGLTAAEQREYQRRLDQQILPFVKSAVESYEKAIENSRELESYNAWIDVAKAGLSTIDIEKYRFDREEILIRRKIDWLGL